MAIDRHRCLPFRPFISWKRTATFAPRLRCLLPFQIRLFCVFLHLRAFSVVLFFHRQLPMTKLILNKAVYTATEVACGWAGAVMPKTPENAEKANGDRQTDRPTDRPTDIAVCRVASTRLKTLAKTKNSLLM